MLVGLIPGLENSKENLSRGEKLKLQGGIPISVADTQRGCLKVIFMVLLEDETRVSWNESSCG